MAAVQSMKVRLFLGLLRDYVVSARLLAEIGTLCSWRLCDLGSWDAVVTCFFIDTAHNIVEYLEIIYKVLKPGGVWINLGVCHLVNSFFVI